MKRSIAAKLLAEEWSEDGYYIDMTPLGEYEMDRIIEYALKIGMLAPGRDMEEAAQYYGHNCSQGFYESDPRLFDKVMHTWTPENGEVRDRAISDYELRLEEITAYIEKNTKDEDE